MGDYFSPRYLSALGTDPQGNFAYIVGGYGSQTGDQMLDPKNYYDLYRYNIQGKSFKKLFTLKPLTSQFTFANSLVVGPDPGKYYGLIFPNDSFNSNLQLIEGSLTDSTYRILGNAIPYSFLDVRSFADLYYSQLNNKLIAVTLFYSKDGAKEKSTEVKIYTLNFPPGELTGAAQTTQEKTHFWYFLISLLAAGLISITVFLIIRRNKRNRLAGNSLQADNTELLPEDIQEITRDEMNDFAAIAGMPYLQGAVEKKHRSSIYLFGQFQVFDKGGNDITGLFTPLLKELFLIIAIYTMRNSRGISSEGLNEILWHDKSEKDAKNNRSVNLAKLKTIFEKIGNCTINKESGYWQFQILDEGICFDYKKYVSILKDITDGNKEYIHSLMEVIRRGVFLYQTDYNWLDNIKSEISNSIIDLCLDFIKSQNIARSPELIIEITNCIFYFDQLNEDALTYQCKSLIFLKRFSLANHTYLNFVKNYKDIYGENFGKSFHELIL
jgi:two-component SAPR family response regulator